MGAVYKGSKTGWAAIAVACVSCFEGVRLYSYYDPVSIPTACFGETKNIRMGQRFTMAECEGMLAESLAEANQGVDTCVKVDLTDERRAALVSFTYNVGKEAMCKSTLVRKLNSHDTQGACDELLRWDKAKGITLPGLTRRRQAERELCLKGLK
jgi:lysozyme